MAGVWACCWGAVEAVPKRVVEGAEVVVVVPNEKAGAEVFGGAPRLNSPPEGAAFEVVLVVVLSPGNGEGCVDCEVEGSKIDFRFPCASVVGFKFSPLKGLLEPP